MAKRIKYRLNHSEFCIAKDALGDLVALNLIAGFKLDRHGCLEIKVSDSHYTKFKLGDGASGNSIVISPTP